MSLTVRRIPRCSVTAGYFSAKAALALFLGTLLLALSGGISTPPLWGADAVPKEKPAAVNKDVKKDSAEKKDAGADAQSKRIAELIEQLGDAQYVVRERAQAELQRIGPPALDALTKALEHPDVEVAMRAKYLSSAIKVEWTVESDPPRIRALMKDYNDKDDDARLETIKDLATGGPAEIAVLCRLVRFEKSHQLSKRAALTIIGLPEPTGQETWGARVATINAGLGATNRAGAEWVRAFLQTHDDVAQALPQWKKLVEAEQQTLQNFPRLTSREIVGELLHREIEMLDQLGRKEESLVYMKALVALESGNEKSVTRLVEWLAQKKAWSVIDDVATRFGQTFDQHALLLYTLAEARLAQGKTDMAKQIGEKALALGGRELIDHLRTGFQLQERGMYHWAELEFRRVAALGPPDNELVLQSYLLLSEMFHDQRKEKEAGQALADMVQQMDAQPAALQKLRAMGRDPGSIRSRMHFFLAEHERLQGNEAAQIELLDKAVANDATDADVLIALYRLKNQPEARRAQNLRRIKAAADAFRRGIQEAPDSPMEYNQLAWLLGNTLGETDGTAADEAIRSSLKSLELRPNSAGYLDTLARCYYAKKDYESAVRHQTEALRLEPHSGLIAFQLEVFKKALDESRKKKDAEPKPKS